MAIFNLDAKHGALRQMRKNAVQGYLQTAEELAEMAALFGEDEWVPFLMAEIKAIKGQPFETAIRHTLML